MKSNILRNIIRCVLVGLFILCLVSMSVRVGLLPKFLGYAKNADGINEVIFNLSYSYLAGLVFFMINDWIPTQAREYNARKSLEENLRAAKHLLDDIYRLITFVEHKHNCKNISLDDLKSETSSGGIIWTKYENGISQSPQIIPINVESYLQMHVNQLYTQIDILTQSPLFVDLNKNLATTIVNLRHNKFLDSCIKSINPMPKTDDFKALYLQFERPSYIYKNKSIYTEPSPAEKMEAEARIKLE